MTCDCADPVVFGHHHDDEPRDTIRGQLRPGEHIIPASVVLNRYTEAMQQLTEAMRAAVQIPSASEDEPYQGCI